MQPSKLLWLSVEFWCSYKSKNNGGKLFPRSPFRNSCKACYEIAWSRQLVLLNEGRSYTDAWICCSEWLHNLYLWSVACDLYWSVCLINRLQLLSIGEWFRDHEETTLVFFRSWSRYFGFSINFQTSSFGFFFFVCFFPDEIAFSSILRIKMIFLGRHSILRE